MKLGSSIFVKNRNHVYELEINSVIPWSNNLGCLYIVRPKSPNYIGSLFVHSDAEFYNTAEEAHASTPTRDLYREFYPGDMIYHVDYNGSIHQLPVEEVRIKKLHRIYQCPVLGSEDYKQHFFDFNDDIFHDYDDAVKFQCKLLTTQKIYLKLNDSESTKAEDPVTLLKIGDTLQYKGFHYEIVTVTEWPRGNGALYSCRSEQMHRHIHSDDPAIASNPPRKFTRYYPDQVLVYPKGFNPFSEAEEPMYVDGEYLFDEYRVVRVDVGSSGVLRYKCKLLKSFNEYRDFFSDDERLCYTAEQAKKWVDKDRAFNLARDRSLMCCEILDSPLSSRAAVDGAFRMV